MTLPAKPICKPSPGPQSVVEFASFCATVRRADEHTLDCRPWKAWNSSFPLLPFGKIRIMSGQVVWLPRAREPCPNFEQISETVKKCPKLNATQTLFLGHFWAYFDYFSRCFSGVGPLLSARHRTSTEAVCDEIILMTLAVVSSLQGETTDFRHCPACDSDIITWAQASSIGFKNDRLLSMCQSWEEGTWASWCCTSTGVTRVMETRHVEWYSCIWGCFPVDGDFAESVWDGLVFSYRNPWRAWEQWHQKQKFRESCASQEIPCTAADERQELCEWWLVGLGAQILYWLAALILRCHLCRLMR